MRKIAIEEHLDVPGLKPVPKGINIDPRIKPPNFETDPARSNLGTLLMMEPSEDRIPLMDKCGLDVQILSCNGDGLQNDLEPERAAENAIRVNDKIAEIVKKYPGRFYGFGLLAMQNPEAAVKEAERCAKELGFVGIMLHGSTCFHYYDEPMFDSIWAKLEELDMPLYLHVGNPESDQIRMYEGYNELLGNTWNWGVTGGTHALRMVFGGVFERHPGAKLILGHMGEHLPYLLGRLDEGYEHRAVWKKGRITCPPSHYIKSNIYITTSGGFNPEAVACAVMGMGVEHILFASDYPHFPLETSMAQLDKCASFLSPKEMALIYGGNAERLFKLGSHSNFTKE